MACKQKGSYSKESLENAIAACKSENFKVREAAKLFGVPKSKVNTGFSGRGGVPGRFPFFPSQLINKATPCLTTGLKVKIG